MFWLIDTGNVFLIGVSLTLLTVGLGLAYGPQSALFAEQFPAAVRYSGASLSYALGAILGGAFAPMIAAWLQDTTSTSMSVSVYLFTFTLIALGAVSLLKDRTGVPLSNDPNDDSPPVPV